MGAERPTDVDERPARIIQKPLLLEVGQGRLARLCRLQQDARGDLRVFDKGPKARHRLPRQLRFPSLGPKAVAL